MDHIPRADKLILILHQAGWSIACTAFAGKVGLSWLVCGTHGDHQIQANGKTQEAAWKQACRQAEEMGLVQPLLRLTPHTLRLDDERDDDSLSESIR
jgi:hypothetical protein